MFVDFASTMTSTTIPGHFRRPTREQLYPFNFLVSLTEIEICCFIHADAHCFGMYHVPCLGVRIGMDLIKICMKIVDNNDKNGFMQSVFLNRDIHIN